MHRFKTNCIHTYSCKNQINTVFVLNHSSKTVLVAAIELRQNCIVTIKAHYKINKHVIDIDIESGNNETII